MTTFYRFADSPAGRRECEAVAAALGAVWPNYAFRPEKRRGRMGLWLAVYGSPGTQFETFLTWAQMCAPVRLRG